jgi:pimeloyl-ACP methyl ester carboxylesterase
LVRSLRAVIEKLQLGKVHVTGHSYGAFTALFLAVKHPELVRTLLLAKPPAFSLLAYLPADQSEVGRATLADIQERMVKPMTTAFQQGNRAAGLCAFMDSVLHDPHAWDNTPDAARQDMLNRAHEWDIMMTTGKLFPDWGPQAVRKIAAPALLLSGEKSDRFLALIDEELARLLPHNHRIILLGATHRMWFEQPEPCRNAVLDFWRNQVSESESK